jgi:hypothetical protein
MLTSLKPQLRRLRRSKIFRREPFFSPCDRSDRTRSLAGFTRLYRSIAHHSLQLLLTLH